MHFSDQTAISKAWVTGTIEKEKDAQGQRKGVKFPNLIDKFLKGQTATQLIKKPVMAVLTCEYILIVSLEAAYFVIKISSN